MALLPKNARLNKPKNINGLSVSSSQNNLNSSNDDGWTQQTKKRNHSCFSEPNSLTQNTNKNKKLFIIRNWFEVLEPIEVDTVTQNSNLDKNNKVHT